MVAGNMCSVSMRVTATALYRAAYRKYAIGGYRVSNVEQVLGIFRGHVQVDSPFMLQISGHREDPSNGTLIEASIRAAEQLYPQAIYAVHLDHGDEERCYVCIDSGFY